MSRAAAGQGEREFLARAREVPAGWATRDIQKWSHTQRPGFTSLNRHHHAHHQHQHHHLPHHPFSNWEGEKPWMKFQVVISSLRAAYARGEQDRERVGVGVRVAAMVTARRDAALPLPPGAGLQGAQRNSTAEVCGEAANEHHGENLEAAHACRGTPGDLNPLFPHS